MPNAKDVNVVVEFLKAFCVGESGTGKSIFAASFPTPGYVFDFGKEILSYRGKDFDYDQFELSAKGWGDYEKAFAEVKKKVNEGVYKTVVVDNLSAMTDLCMEKAMMLDPKRSATGGPIWNVHYQMVKNLMDGKIRQFLNLKCNIVLIAHLSLIRDDEGSVVGVEPALTGQLSVDVPSYFDEVYYHSYRKEGGDTKWFVQTIPIGRNHGRSRLSGKQRLLPDMIENDYAEVMAYVTGAKVKPATTKTNTQQLQTK